MARKPNCVAYHPTAGRHLSGGIRGAATAVQHRIVVIGRSLMPKAADTTKPQVTQVQAVSWWLSVLGMIGSC